MFITNGRKILQAINILALLTVLKARNVFGSYTEAVLDALLEMFPAKKMIKKLAKFLNKHWKDLMHIVALVFLTACVCLSLVLIISYVNIIARPRPRSASLV